MKVLLFLCACFAASSAGIIGYPVAPVAYHTNYIVGHPFPIARPVGFPVALGPSYFSYNLIPGNVVFPGVPGVVHYLPVAPATPPGKGKPDKKKPGDKKDDKDDKGTKEETTEEPKKEGESAGGETEDLAE